MKGFNGSLNLSLLSFFIGNVSRYCDLSVLDPFYLAKVGQRPEPPSTSVPYRFGRKIIAAAFHR
jgi:hypothetical protein